MASATDFKDSLLTGPRWQFATSASMETTEAHCGVSHQGLPGWCFAINLLWAKAETKPSIEGWCDGMERHGAAQPTIATDLVALAQAF